MASRQIGTRPRKIARHPNSSTRNPPPSEPVIIPRVPRPPMIPSARPLKSSGNSLVTIAGPSAISRPLPTDWNTRSPKTTPRFSDSPIATTLAVYATRPTMNMRLSPNTSAAPPSPSCIAVLLPT